MRGGGAKAVYKLYKKTGEMVKGAFPKFLYTCAAFSPTMGF